MPPLKETDANIDVKLMQLGQTVVIGAFLLGIGISICKLAGVTLYAGVDMAPLAMMMVGVRRMAKGIGRRRLATWGWAFLMLVPVVNLIALWRLNRRASTLLRQHGFKVGLFGARAPQ